MSNKRIPQSIDDLTTEQAFDFLSMDQDVETRVQKMVSLYINKPEISSFVSKTYGYTPEEFTRKLMQAIKILKDQLPEAYELIPKLEVKPLKLGISSLDFSYKEITALHVDISIMSNGCELESREWYEKNKQDTPQLKSFSEFLKKREEKYGAAFERISIAGSFNFQLFREEVDDQVYDILLVYSINLEEANKFWIRPKDEVDLIMPIPLGWKEDRRLNIPHYVVKLNEELIKNIAHDHDTEGFIITNYPTDDGEKVFKREGYSRIDQLEEKNQRFKKCKVVSCNVPEAFYKVVYTP